MAAIDLLFQFKRESERMHQMVLGILLTETRLLSRLVPLTGLQQPSANQLHWEPEARTYDLAAPLHQHPASAPAGRVLIELKLDGTLDEDQIYKQAITSAATGCQAALDAERYLDALNG